MRVKQKADSRGRCGHTLQLKDVNGVVDWNEVREKRRKKKEKHE